MPATFRLFVVSVLLAVCAVGAPHKTNVGRQAPDCELILDENERLATAEMLLLHAAKRRQQGSDATLGDDEMRALGDIRSYGGAKELKLLEALSEDPDLFAPEDRELLTQIALLMSPNSGREIEVEIQHIIGWTEAARYLNRKGKSLAERYETLAPKIVASIQENTVTTHGYSVLLENLHEKGDVELALAIADLILAKHNIAILVQASFAKHALAYARYTLQQVLRDEAVSTFEIGTALSALRRFSQKHTELVLGEAAIETIIAAQSNAAMKKLYESLRLEHLQPLRKRLIQP